MGMERDVDSEVGLFSKKKSYYFGHERVSIPRYIKCASRSGVGLKGGGRSVTKYVLNRKNDVQVKKNFGSGDLFFEGNWKNCVSSASKKCHLIASCKS